MLTMTSFSAAKMLAASCHGIAKWLAPRTNRYQVPNGRMPYSNARHYSTSETLPSLNVIFISLYL